MKKFPEFYYNLQTVYFVSDFGYAFMEKNQFELSAVPKAAGEDVLVNISDIRKIYAPYMEVAIDSETATAEMGDTVVKVKAGSKDIVVNGNTIKMTEAAQLIDGKFFVPAGDFMKLGFDKLVAVKKSDPNDQSTWMSWPRENIIVAISNSEEYNLNATAFIVTATKRTEFKFDPAMISFLNVALRGKYDGELYKAYYFEEADKVMPYSLYVPYKYNPDKPSKMVVALHGGGLAEQYIYTLSKNMMQFYCEKYNYIFLGPNACVKGSSYGCLIPNKQSCNPKPGYDPKNPMGFSDEEIARRQLGDKSVMKAIEIVMKDYNIDKKRVYLMGNSMGAIGTFHLPTAHPGVFRAIAPSGGCPHLGYFDLSKLKGVPIRLVVGTDDHLGFDYLKYGRDKILEAGLELDFCVIGGGIHYDSWAYGLEGTFEFFEKNA